MGAPKQKWLAEEEEALRAGVEKHGAGKWRTIQKDPEFSHCLASRSNIDLKVVIIIFYFLLLLVLFEFDSRICGKSKEEERERSMGYDFTFSSFRVVYMMQ